MIQTCNCRCCQFWEAEIAKYIHKSLVEKEWVRKDDVGKEYIAKKGAIYMDKSATPEVMEMMGYIRKDSLATKEEIKKLFLVFQNTEHFQQTECKEVLITGIPTWNYDDLAQAIVEAQEGK